MNKSVMAGFTIVELMITLVIIAIVASLGVPAFRETIQNNRMATQFNELVGSLNIARSEAVKRGARTRVCKGTAPTCDNSATGWEQGWFVWVDGNDDGSFTPGDTNGNGRWDQDEDELIQVFGSLSGGNTLRGNTNVADEVSFNTQGFSSDTGTIRLCDSRGAGEARGLVINNTGRIRRTVDSNSDGVEEDGSGSALTCP
jgi:type IV fimbrial biogenesis protein FimT